jgi:endogenous inhibitor of DNA gyrase (YacG/DUF329 family)
MQENARGLSAKPCPICGKPSTEATRPFCSRRCADVDLHRWLTGRYVIPGQEHDDENGVPRDGGAPREKPES